MSGAPASEGPIVIVEDDDDIRLELGELLEGEGYAVVTARDGAEGLSALRARPDARLVLLDLMMPVKNGWEFRAEQLADPSIADVPVVIVSGAGDLRKAAAELRADACLAKPLRIEQLFAALETHARKGGAAT